MKFETREQLGFTLIELMIVVAIIAILAAIALPAYQDYVIRTQVSEGLVLASGAKTAITDTYTHNGSFPADNPSAGLAAVSSITGKFVTGVDVSQPAGTITVTYGGLANAAVTGSTLVLSAITSADAGSIAWSCKSTVIAPKYLPTNCRP